MADDATRARRPTRARPARRFGRRYGLAAALLLAGVWLWHADVWLPFAFPPAVQRDLAAPGGEALRLPDHDYGVLLSPDGRTVACCVPDRPPTHRLIQPTIRRAVRSTVSFWQVPQARPLGECIMRGRADADHAVFSPDGRLFACVSRSPLGNSGLLALWQVPVTEPLWQTRWQSGEGSPLDVAGFSPDSRSLLGLTDAEWSTHVSLWDARTGRLRWTAPDNLSGLSLVSAWSPDGKTVAAGCESQGSHLYVTLYDAASGARIRKLSDQQWERISAIAFSRDGDLLAATGWETGGAPSVVVWNAPTGRRLRYLADRQYGFTMFGDPGLGFLGDDRTLLWGRYTLDVRDPRAQPRLACRGKVLRWISFWAQDDGLALFSVWDVCVTTGPRGGTVWAPRDCVELWDVRASTLRRTWTGVGSAAVGFSPKTHLLVEALWDEVIWQRLELPPPSPGRSIHPRP